MIDAHALEGRWQRGWIEIGLERDAETQVHWWQCGPHFVDVRVPADLPDVGGVAALSDLDPATLLPFLRAEGFAGRIELAENTCVWNRWINWHGVPERADIGVLSYDHRGDLVEDAPDGSYRELWQHMTGAPLMAQLFDLGDRSGILLTSGEDFLVGYGPAPCGSSAALVAALGRGEWPEEAVAAHFASEYALGRWEGSEGIATLSTHPLRAGSAVLERRGGSVAILADDIRGARRAFPLNALTAA